MNHGEYLKSEAVLVTRILLRFTSQPKNAHSTEIKRGNEEMSNQTNKQAMMGKLDAYKRPVCHDKLNSVNKTR